MINSFNRERLKREKRLLPDRNPWEFDPLQFTVLFASNVLGAEAKRIVMSYFHNPTLGDLHSFWEFTAEARRPIYSSGEPKVTLYSSRAWLLWWHTKHTTAWRHTPEHNDRLRVFKSEPLITVADWLAERWQPTNHVQVEIQPRGENGSKGNYSLPAKWRPPADHFPKTCPRCRGSMRAELDWYGSYASCFVCGYVHEPTTNPPIDLPENEDGRPRQRRRQPSHGKIRL